MALDIDMSHGDVGHRRAVDQQPVDGRHRWGTAPSNAELLAGCQLGDVGSWNEVVSRYERLVYAIPLREGLSASDAAEISQSTFEALVESLERIRNPDRLGYWLMTVARRLTWRRREVNRAEVSFGDLPTESETDDHAADWVRTVAVYDAVAELPDPCRALVVGLFFDPAEPSYDQLARTLGCAVGSIGPRRSRCLERLRDRLDS